MIPGFSSRTQVVRSFWKAVKMVAEPAVHRALGHNAAQLPFLAVLAGVAVWVPGGQKVLLQAVELQAGAAAAAPF